MFYIQIALSLFLFFYFSLSKSVCPTIPHCLQCIDQLTCIKCRQNYKLERNVCVYEKQKMKRFLQAKPLNSNSDLNSIAVTDLSALILPSNKNADNFTRFQYFSNPTRQPQKDTICLYQSKGVCYICGDKYQMGSEGHCYPKFNKCLSFTKDLICKQCHPHFQHQRGTCVDVGCSVKNYYQCKDCKKGYILNEHFYCLAEYCNEYQNGKCKKCKNQFSLKADICIKDSIRKDSNVVQQPSIVIEHCNRTQNSKCMACNQGFYLTQDKCKRVPYLCKIFDFVHQICEQCRTPALLMQGSCSDPHCVATDQITQLCSACAVGYVLNEEKVCLSANNDQNCISKVANMCSLCRLGYFINTQSKCEKFPDNCLDKQCVYCRSGYISIKNKCQKLQNCQKFIKNTCQNCNPGYSVTQIGTCIKSVDNCLKYTSSGCENCPANYFLTQNQCVLNKNFQDPNCIKRNFRSECSLCKLNFRLEPKYKNLCVPSNRECRTSMQGICTSCYQGYKLNELTGDCIIIKPIQNCADQAQDICKKCAPRYYLKNSVTCTQVDSLCDGYSQDTGQCSSCYSGYALFEGRCLVFAENKLIPTLIQSKESIPKPLVNQSKNQTSTANCLKKDKSSKKCLKCYDSFILNPQSGLCIGVNPLCKTYSPTNGSCLTCYEGYKVSAPNCVLEQKNSLKIQEKKRIQQSYRQHCKRADDIKKQCVECLDRHYKDDKICREVSPQCKTYNAKTGACSSCYTGYIVQQRQCVVLNNVVVPVENCQFYDQNSLKCTKCAEEYIVKNNLCEKIPLGCLKYDESKDQCAECREGYVKNLLNICVVPALGEIKNCSKYDESGYCVQCSNNSILQNYMCSSGRSR